MPDVTEIDTETGVVTERSFTAAEIAQRTADVQAALDAQAAADAATAAAQVAKDSAVAKLAALGLTVDDLAALGL